MIFSRRGRRKKDHVAIIRIEQLYPFHTEMFEAIFKKYKDAREYYWVQEEPRNMGAWEYIRPILNEHLPKGGAFHYVGRKRAASPAIGSHSMHVKEHAQIMHIAFEEVKDESRN